MRCIGVRRDRHSGHVSYKRIGLAACEWASGDGGEVSLTQCKPVWSIVRQPDVARDLEHDQSEREDVRRLIILAVQDLWSDVSAIALAFDTSCSRPLRCQSKIPNFQLALIIDKDIGRLEVQMDDPSFMNAL